MMLVILETPNGNEIKRMETITFMPVIRIPEMSEIPCIALNEYNEISPNLKFFTRDYYVYRVDRTANVAYYRERTSR